MRTSEWHRRASRGTERTESLKVLAEHKLRYMTGEEIGIVWPELADRIDSEEQDDARDATLKELKTLARNTYRTVRKHSKAAAGRARTEEEAALAKALCGRGKSSAGRVLACKREDYENVRATLWLDIEKFKGKGPEARARRLKAAKDIAELDARIEEVEQAERLLEVQEDLGEARAWHGVLIGVLALASPEEARDLQQLGSGGLDILEGLATMAAGSLLDPTGISMVLKGIGTLVGLAQQPGRTHEEFVRETLEELLKGQDWIGGELDGIERRVAVLQSDVNALTDIMRMSLAEGREDRAAIADTHRSPRERHGTGRSTARTRSHHAFGPRGTPRASREDRRLQGTVHQLDGAPGKCGDARVRRARREPLQRTRPRRDRADPAIPR